VKLQLPGKKKQSSKEINLDTTPKKKKKSTDFTYSYSIIPTNFINLSEEAQVQKLSQFFDILNVIDDRIKITMNRLTEIMTSFMVHFENLLEIIHIK